LKPPGDATARLVDGYQHGLAEPNEDAAFHAFGVERQAEGMT
jgi:hypothetical protein